MVGLLALLLASAGVTIGWLRPWQTSRQSAPPATSSPVPTTDAARALTAPVPERVANAEPERLAAASQPLARVPDQPAPTIHAEPTPRATVSAPAVPAPVVAPPARAPAPAVSAPLTASPPPLPAAPANDAPQASPVKSDPVKVAGAPPADPAVTAQTEATPAPPAPSPPRVASAEESVPAMSDLPESLRKEIPRVAIAVHFFSAQRDKSLVNINGQTLHEGDEVMADLKPERITATGVVLAYKGNRFYQTVQGR